jgi:serine/threonine protein kinase
MTSSHNSDKDFVNSPLLSETLLQDRYRIVKQLGKGGMGAVYEAVDERLGITVALKEVLSAEPSMRKQFEHEARLLASMQHPSLPRVSDHFVEGHRAFLVMQFISGIDLGRIISQQPGPFPRDQVIAWADQLLDALIYLHSRDRQVIHRDIKPHNLKLTSTGQIALLDFGLAKAQPADSSLTSSRAFFGYTKHYAPLEQIQDERTDPRSDIYALGATLYHLLTGIKPPDALVRASALLNGEPDPLKLANKIHPLVGAEISTILFKAMALKSEERFSTASEFREALRRMVREPHEQKLASVVGKEGAESEFTEIPRHPSVNLNLAMVASAPRFGPGGLTIVLLIVGAIAAGVVYAAPNWLGSMDNLPAQTSASSSVSEAGKPARSNVQPTAFPRTRNLTYPSAETKVTAKETKPEVRTAPKRVTEETPSPTRVRRKVGAPSIRLPEPSDGTHIVKFSDGTTRVIRPVQTGANR